MLNLMTAHKTQVGASHPRELMQVLILAPCNETPRMQEFIGLLGMDSKYSGGSFSTSESAEDRCSSSSCPCCSGGNASNMAAVSLQQRQKEENMAAAVEAVLREIGEDPNREVYIQVKYFAGCNMLQAVLS